MNTLVNDLILKGILILIIESLNAFENFPFSEFDQRFWIQVPAYLGSVCDCWQLSITKYEIL